MRTKIIEVSEDLFEYVRVGWIIEYSTRKANEVSYLRVVNYDKMEVEATTSLNNCSVFIIRKEAIKWAKAYPDLINEEGHGLPEIRPIWHISAHTLKDPNSKGTK